MSDKLNIRAMYAPWHRGVELLVRDGTQYGIRVEMQPRGDGQNLDPTLTISETAAQVLMDDLWAAGIRPTEGAGSAGAMRRAEAHIEDLRKIAFKTLGVE